MKIKVKRVYDAPSDDDGLRILVDRLWPRGLSKADAALDEWLKELGPSKELRQWFNHEEAKWPEFQRRFAEELSHSEALWKPLLAKARKQRVTLLFGSHEATWNNAMALQAFLQNQTPR